MNTNADEWHNGKKTMACQCSTTALLNAYRERKALPADGSMNGKIFFDAVNAGEPDAVEVLEKFCLAVDVQIYNLTVLLDLEKVAIGGGISKQPILIETEPGVRGRDFEETPLQRGTGPQSGPSRDRALRLWQRGQPDRRAGQLPERILSAVKRECGKRLFAAVCISNLKQSGKWCIIMGIES